MAWLTGWGRRKSKNIAGSTAGAQANYQMLKIRVHKTTGTDTSSGANGTLQHVYVGANVRDDFGDVVFTKADGTSLLDFWMETYVSGDYADFYVEVDSIPASADTVDIYVYYDKSDETTVSDGGAAFIAFDDFEDGVMTNWTADAGTWTETGGVIKITTDTHRGRIYYNPAQYGTATYEFKEKRPGTDIDWAVGPIISRTDASNYVYLLRATPYGGTWPTGYFLIAKIVANSHTPLSDQLAFTMAADTWYLHSVTVDVANNKIISWKIDGTEYFSNIVDAVIVTGYIGLFGHMSPNTEFDDFRIRKYASPEPSWGAFGSEETPPAVGQPTQLRTRLIPGMNYIGVPA